MWQQWRKEKKAQTMFISPSASSSTTFSTSSSSYRTIYLLLYSITSYWIDWWMVWLGGWFVVLLCVFGKYIPHHISLFYVWLLWLFKWSEAAPFPGAGFSINTQGWWGSRRSSNKKKYMLKEEQFGNPFDDAEFEWLVTGYVVYPSSQTLLPHLSLLLSMKCTVTGWQ